MAALVEAQAARSGLSRQQEQQQHEKQQDSNNSSHWHSLPVLGGMGSQQSVATGAAAELPNAGTRHVIDGARGKRAPVTRLGAQLRGPLCSRRTVFLCCSSSTGSASAPRTPRTIVTGFGAEMGQEQAES